MIISDVHPKVSLQISYLDKDFGFGESVRIEGEKGVQKKWLGIFCRKRSSRTGKITNHREIDAAVSLDDGITVGQLVISCDGREIFDDGWQANSEWVQLAGHDAVKLKRPVETKNIINEDNK